MSEEQRKKDSRMHKFILIGLPLILAVIVLIMVFVVIPVMNAEQENAKVSASLLRFNDNSTVYNPFHNIGSLVKVLSP